MKKIAFIFLSLMTVGIAQASTKGIYDLQSNASAFEFRSLDNKSFQVGEKLTYRVHYGFVDAGEATLEVLASNKKVNGRDLVHVVGKGRSLGTFNWFFKVQDRYETYLDAEGIFPWMFVRRVYEGGYEINQDYTFYQHKQKVDDGKKSYDVPSDIQDMISSYYYARTLDFSNAKIGDVFEFKSFVDGEVYPVRIKYLGKDNIKIRNGKFACLKFCPVIQTGRIFKNEEDLTVWISDDENKIPLLAKANILVGSIKMEVTEYEGLRNKVAKL
jgi:hypothetical protein